MGFDWLRSCYQTKARPWSDSNAQIDIRWFFCDPGAQPFPFPHAYGSLNWHDPNAPGRGEVPGAPRSYRKGSGPTTLPGDHFCGQADWFLHGAPVAAPNVSPLFCCGQPFRGQFIFRGVVQLVKGFFLQPFGDMVVRGNVPIRTGPELLPSGREVFTGNPSPLTGPSPSITGGTVSTGTVPVITGPSPLSVHGQWHFDNDTALTVGPAPLSVHGQWHFRGNVIPEQDDMLPGMIVPYGGSSAPAGYLLCDGSSVLRSTYAALFAVIGTSFGFVDSTHFNLPDLQRRVPMGAGGTAVQLPVNTVGSVGGAEQVTLASTQIPAHLHPCSFSALSTGPTAGNQSFQLGAAPNTTAAPNTGLSTGGGLPHNNNQPSLVVNYLIKT
jgi:microcystin-dependent protein